MDSMISLKKHLDGWSPAASGDAALEAFRALLLAAGSAGQREENNEADQGQDSDDEDAAFRAGGSAAENWLAHGVRGEEMVLGH